MYKQIQIMFHIDASYENQAVMKTKALKWFDLRKKLSHHPQLFYIFIIIFTSRKMYGKSQHPLFVTLLSFFSFNYFFLCIPNQIEVSVLFYKSSCKNIACMKSRWLPAWHINAIIHHMLVQNKVDEMKE